MPHPVVPIAALPACWEFAAIGTGWRIDTAAELPAEVREAVADRIARFDADWSRFRDDSLVARMAHEPGRYRLPDDAGPLLERYAELYAATGGRMSPLVGRALGALGYGAGYRLRPAAARERVPAWADALAWDGVHLDVATPVELDIGAAGKGYLVDIVSGMLTQAGIHDSVVDASGDLVARGDASLRIALEDPRDTSRAIGVVELADGALCASATNRRAWGDGLHHVLDALTGEPTAAILATWVLAPTGLVADGLATALFFDPDPRVLDAPGVHWLRLTADGIAQRSRDFPGEVFA